ncbi:MAG: deoxyguanosinetriphosphate triphosphohydrolase [Planctomycetaceae bacterium]|nr:deoxyguanosinetriphosphate triphosphohydrolase [Planctomycetaceae bacterium]
MKTSREIFEQHHSAFLAPFAVREGDSGGRRHDESEHPYRTCFQRDRDRIIHCSAFRRLDFKTQVFVPHECDHFRTRMTHTLEVAQIARNLARALRLNEDLAEAVALAHDLGHPPFGHAGEAALNELMAAHGGFEHNRQSLRVVDYLEHPYPAFRGLNLTQAVRECLAKHETAYDKPSADEFDPALAGPLEGQLVDMADAIAYTSADLEDSLAAGLISLEHVSRLALWRRAWSAAQAADPDAGVLHTRIRACKGVLAAMADDVIASTTSTLEALKPANPDDVRRGGRKCVVFSKAIAEEVAAMQRFLFERVYTFGESAARADASGKMLRELFAAYLSNPALMGPRYLRRSREEGLHRVICDYLAGMTDRFCKQAHAGLDVSR